jgi:hypothetical protein
VAFDFWKFYSGLGYRTSWFDSYWDKFPEGHLFQFKTETLSLLRSDIANKDPEGLTNTLAVISRDGADRDYTELLLGLLDETWHRSEEDIVSVLEQIKDPASVEKLYATAINIPDWDDMRGLAKKCMWALRAINTAESIRKLRALQSVNDDIIKENATFQLENVAETDSEVR